MLTDPIVALLKAQFATRSEAARYAAQQRWKGHVAEEPLGPIDDALVPTEDFETAFATGRPYAPLLVQNFPPELKSLYDAWYKRAVEAEKVYLATYQARESRRTDTESGSYTFEEESLRSAETMAVKELESKMYAALTKYYESVITPPEGSKAPQWGDAKINRVVAEMVDRFVHRRMADIKEDLTTIQDGDFWERNGANKEGFIKLQAEVVGERARVAVTVPASVVEKILADGRIKSQFETHTSGGLKDKAIRQAWEATVMGILPQIAGKNRPIYANLHPFGVQSTRANLSEQYGDVQFVLKKDVRSRTTFNMEDSLGENAVVPMNDPQRELTVMRPVRRSTVVMRGLPSARKGEGYSYFEAQIHGGVSLDDVAYVVVNKSSATEGAADALRKAGFEVLTVDTPEPHHNVMGVKQPIVDDQAVYKAQFATRSEAARYAAEQRWKGHAKEEPAGVVDPRLIPTDDINEAIREGRPYAPFMWRNFPPEIFDLGKQITDLARQRIALRLPYDTALAEQAKKEGKFFHSDIQQFPPEIEAQVRELISKQESLDRLLRKKLVEHIDKIIGEAQQNDETGKFADWSDEKTIKSMADYVAQYVFWQETVGLSALHDEAMRRLAGSQKVFWGRPLDTEVDDAKMLAMQKESTSDSARIAITVPADVLPLILKTGNFKNQFGSNSSQGLYDKSLRKAFEAVVLGIVPTTKPSIRPIYANLHPFGVVHTQVNNSYQYGDIQFVMKREVRERTTMNLADSLGEPECLPMNDATSRPMAMTQWVRRQVANSFEQSRKGVESGYMEAQIHGGVTLKDVAYVVVNKAAASDEVLKSLKDAGLEVKIVGYMHQSSSQDDLSASQFYPSPRVDDEGVYKAQFASRSEAARYAAEQRWKGHAKEQTSVQWGISEQLVPVDDLLTSIKTGRPWSRLLEENWPPKFKEAVALYREKMAKYDEIAAAELKRQEDLGYDIDIYGKIKRVDEKAAQVADTLETLFYEQVDKAYYAVGKARDEFWKEIDAELDASGIDNKFKQKIREYLPFAFGRTMVQEIADRTLQAHGVKKDMPDPPISEQECLKLQEECVGKDARVAIGVPPEVVDAILRQGVFKSQFKTRKSQGKYDQAMRAAAEMRLFGLPPNTDAMARPIYATLHPFGVMNSEVIGAGQYGGVQFVLKTDVHSRTTFNWTDSLPERACLPMGDPTTKVFTISPVKQARMRTRVTRLKAHKSSGYMEAQIHGGVTLKDVAYVAIDEKIATPELVAKFTTKNIPVKIVGRITKLSELGGPRKYEVTDPDAIQPIVSDEDVYKAQFASRSEAARYAAQQRWKGHATEETSTPQYPKLQELVASLEVLGEDDLPREDGSFRRLKTWRGVDKDGKVVRIELEATFDALNEYGDKEGTKGKGDFDITIQKEGQNIGFLHGSNVDDPWSDREHKPYEMVIGEINVAKSHRRRGIATLLLDLMRQSLPPKWKVVHSTNLTDDGAAWSAVAKARFASRSEAGRYAAEQRWKGRSVEQIVADWHKEVEDGEMVIATKAGIEVPVLPATTTIDGSRNVRDYWDLTQLSKGEQGRRAFGLEKEIGELSSENVGALTIYQWGSRVLNKLLRGRLKDEQSMKTLRLNYGNALRLDKLMDEFPRLTNDVVVHRGVTRNGFEALAGLAVGTVFQDKGFVSTSFSRNKAMNFMRGGMVTILCPVGTKGISFDLAPSSAYEEREFLLPRSTQFEVVSKGETSITLRVVAQ